jgi:MoaA/NifB/PqqE/SkfB family radical SAM enzyme
MTDSKHPQFWTCGQEKMIFFTATKVVGCCANLKTAAQPLLGNYGPQGALDIEELVSAKRTHLAMVRRGETPPECRDCPSWQLHQGPDDNPYLFNEVNIGHHTACNTDCYYCRTNSNSAPHPVPARLAPRLLPVLTEMVERGYIDPNAVVRFGGGEPTILPEFEKLVDYFLGVGRRFFIASSGVRYSPAIERMLRNGRVDSSVVISIDSASRETYEIIKGLDLADRVWDNIARYAAIGPDVVEVKYIVLPENAHETAAFVQKCYDIGVKRVSVDLDVRPTIFGFNNSLTDEIVDGIAVLIYEAKRKGMSVYHSGGGDAVWQDEDGERRVNAALIQISGGRYSLTRAPDGFFGLAQLPQKLDNRSIVKFGQCENATAKRLIFEPKAVYLEEDASFSLHRIEQVGVPVVPKRSYTIEVVARPRGRKRLMIEFRDNQHIAYTRATFDLEQTRVMASMNEDAVAIGRADSNWVRCQLSLTPTSDVAIFNVTLIDHNGSAVYQGRGQGGIDIRPPIIGQAGRTS